MDPIRRRNLIVVAVLAAVGVLAIIVTVVIVGLDGAGGSSGSGGEGSPVARPSPSSPSPTRTATPSPTPTPTPASPEAAPPAPDPPPAPTCADDLLDCVNQVRAANGLGALAADGTLNGAAQACAERMAAAGDLSHSSGAPAGYSAWGENIAVGYPSVASVFEGWMGSDGHRANILNPAYTVMGSGYVGSGNWWCQQFGG